MPNDPKFPQFKVEGWKPPTEAGKARAGDHAAPRKEGESEAAYQARVARWKASYAARGGVRIAEMNQGQLNKFAASGGPRRGEMIGSRIAQFQQKGSKPDTKPNPQVNPGTGGYENDMRGPKAAPNPPTGGTGPRPEPGPRQESQGTDRSNIIGPGASAGLMNAPGSRRGFGKRAGRRAAQAARRGGR